jgi:glycosyltransferase involved in cell wall biosynthesis
MTLTTTPNALKPNALKVLLVTPRYFPLMGGIETHVYEVARRFAAQGVSATVLTTDTSGELPADEWIDDVHILRLPAYPRRQDFYFAPAIYNVIVRGDWDIVHCQGFHTFVPPIAMLAAKQARIPYVLSFHSGGHSSGFRNSIRELQSALNRPLLAGADKLIAVSKFEAALFQKRLRLPPDRFVVIPNGSQLPRITPVSVDSTNPTILSVGRLERYKGHHRVIQAFPKILESQPNARLRILGKGPHEDALRQMARDLGVADRTEIGAVSPTDREGMASILSNAAVVTLLSEYEAHPIAVMEALSLKRPVLVADTSGLTELAEQGLVRAIPLNSSASEVAAAVLEQLRDPLIPSSIELPTWEQCASQLLNVYGEVLKAHPARYDRIDRQTSIEQYGQ